VVRAEVIQITRPSAQSKVKATSRSHKKNHENANVRNIGQDEARHRKYERLKLGGG
jgi:hypothetical protein